MKSSSQRSGRDETLSVATPLCVGECMDAFTIRRTEFGLGIHRCERGSQYT